MAISELSPLSDCTADAQTACAVDELVRLSQKPNLSYQTLQKLVVICELKSPRWRHVRKYHAGPGVNRFTPRRAVQGGYVTTPTYHAPPMLELST